EIAASSASIDLRDKKRVYRRNGVKEYLVWQVMEGRFDWFFLQDGEYISLTPDAEEIIRSRVFPGLWLSVCSLLNGNMLEVMATLQTGLATPEHQQFLQ
ncbi:MAG: Uma2 family endonuclease, partial [Planktothrix sp.]